MISIQLVRSSNTPIYKQIVFQIQNLISQGAIMEGEILPPTREFAIRLGVSRVTVCRAYEELWATGYISSRSGAYSRIRKRPEIVNMQIKQKSAIDWSVFTKPKRSWAFIDNSDSSHSKEMDFIDMSRLHMDERLFPMDWFRKCARNVFSKDNRDFLNYSNPFGLLSLREWITHRLQSHSIFAAPENLLLTNGSQQAIDLICQCLLKNGDLVIAETPTYGLAVDAIINRGADLIQMPMTKQGMDLSEFENLIADEKPKFVYTIPSFHNPTGITTNQEHREKLLSVCTRHKIPLVEDGFLEEIKFFGKSVLPIKSMDNENVVIFLGSFSKVLAPGLRIGWILGDQTLINGLAQIKHQSEICSCSVSQMIFFEFASNGYLDSHLKKLNKVYAKRMTIAINSLKKKLPKEVTWIEPSGGYLIWLKILTHGKTPFFQQKLCDNLKKCKVRVSFGNQFAVNENSNEIHARISISMLDENEISEGIARLSSAIMLAWS